MYSTFSGCFGLTEVNVSGFDTGKVKNIANMFSGCSNLMSLGVSSFEISNVAGMRDMFSGCSRLSTEITVQVDGVRGGGFSRAATEPGSKIIVKYGGSCTLEAAEQLVATKLENSHVYLEGREAAAASVTRDQTELTLKKEEMADLFATIAPADAWEAYTWTSDNPSMAVVGEEGTVTGVSEGQTVIRLTIGSVNAERRVTVGSETAVRAMGIALNESRAALSIFGYPQQTLQLMATTKDGSRTASCIVSVTTPTISRMRWPDRRLQRRERRYGRCEKTITARGGIQKDTGSRLVKSGCLW